tara:strand:+ start:238 stop:765 length:528 start_codon:yes stop_codon:yes gene_type:complete
MKNTIYKIPLIFTFFIFIIFLYFLIQDKDPSVPQSALMNKNVPQFEANDLLDENLTFNNEIFLGKKSIINFFASWCSPCKVEHSILIEISKNNKDVLMVGVNHKDKKSDAIEFIKTGNPYNYIAIDKDGKLAMDFGVYGLPETFVLDENGIIIFKHVGPITSKLYEKEIKKLLTN